MDSQYGQSIWTVNMNSKYEQSIWTVNMILFPSRSIDIQI